MKILQIFLATLIINPSVVNTLNHNEKQENINLLAKSDLQHNILITILKEFIDKQLSFREFIDKIHYYLIGTIDKINNELHYNPTFETYKTLESLKNNYWQFRTQTSRYVNTMVGNDSTKEAIKSLINSWDKMIRNLTSLAHYSKQTDELDYITKLLKKAQDFAAFLQQRLMWFDKNEIFNIKNVIKNYDILYRDFSLQIGINSDIFEQRMTFKNYLAYQELLSVVKDIPTQFTSYIERMLGVFIKEINKLFKEIAYNKAYIDSYYEKYQKFADMIEFLREEEISQTHAGNFANLEHAFICLKELFNKTEQTSLDDVLKQLENIKSNIIFKNNQITQIGVWDEITNLVNIFKEVEAKVNKKKLLPLNYNFKDINEVINEIRYILSTVKYKGINYFESHGSYTKYWLTDDTFVSSNLKQIAGFSTSLITQILDLLGVFKSFDVELNGYGIYFELYDACLVFAWLYGLKTCVVNLSTQSPKYLNYQT